MDWILNACTAPHPDKGDRTQPCAPQVMLWVEHLAFYVLSYLNYIYHRASRSWSADLSFKKWEEEEGMPEDHELKGAWHADNHQEGIQHNHWACWKGPAGKIVRNGRREAAPTSRVVNLDFRLRNSHILTLGHSL